MADPRDQQGAQDLDALQERLAGLEERPVNEHPDVLESVHGALAGELDRLVIPRAQAGEQERDRHAAGG